MKSRQITTIAILVFAAVTIPLLYFALQQVNFFMPRATSLDPQRITITNLSETSASLTWTTPGVATIGSINWGISTDLGDTQTDIRDKRDNTTQARRTHTVTLTGLQPNTTYYYRILVGTKPYPAADVAPASFKTLATSTETQPTTLSLYGTITGSNLDVIVTGYVKSSFGYGNVIPLSAVPNTDGTWYLNIAAARVKSTGAYILPTETTSVVIINDGGNIGEIVTKTSADSPIALPLTMTTFSQATINAALGISGSGTATPTTTSTPTATPTPTVTPGNQDIPIVPIGSTTTPTPSSSTTTLTADDIYNSFVSPSISNVSDTNVSIMWLSNNEEAEVISYGTSTNAMTSTKRDDRDTSAAIPHRIHHMSLSFLTQNTSYYFKTTTDSTPRTFTTPTAITPPENTQIITGAFTNAVGECLVRTQIKRGSVLSSVITTLPGDDYNWSVNISPVRNAALNAYFTPSNTDTVVTNAFCVAANGDIWYVAKSMTVKSALAGNVSLTLTKLP